MRFLAIFGQFFSSGAEFTKSKISDFVFLAFLLIFLYVITLSAIHIDNIACLEPFLPLLDHYLNSEVLGTEMKG